MFYVVSAVVVFYAVRYAERICRGCINMRNLLMRADLWNCQLSAAVKIRYVQCRIRLSAYMFHIIIIFAISNYTQCVTPCFAKRLCPKVLLNALNSLFFNL